MLIKLHSIIWEDRFRGGQGLQHAVASSPLLQKAACLMLSRNSFRHSSEFNRKQGDSRACHTHEALLSALDLSLYHLGTSRGKGYSRS